jgi:hypothetical protein
MAQNYYTGENGQLLKQAYLDIGTQEFSEESMNLIDADLEKRLSLLSESVKHVNGNRTDILNQMASLDIRYSNAETVPPLKRKYDHIFAKLMPEAAQVLGVPYNPRRPSMLYTKLVKQDHFNILPVSRYHK